MRINPEPPLFGLCGEGYSVMRIMSNFTNKKFNGNKRSKAVLCLLATFFVISSFMFPSNLFSQGLTIPATDSLLVNTGSLCVIGDVTIAGSLELSTGTIGLTGNWTNTGVFTPGTGTVIFKGDSTQIINTGGTGTGNFFYNFVHDGTGTARIVTNELNVTNNFNNKRGTFDTNDLDISVGGDWTQLGTFDPSTNTVDFDGGDQAINGATTFYNFNKVITSSSTLTFQNGEEQRVSNRITMQGADASNLLGIKSDVDGTEHYISLLPAGFQSLSFLSIQDSNAGGGVTLAAGSNSVDLGGNTNWTFGATTLTWDGDIDNDWDDPSNWEEGFVPGTADSVIIPSSPANQPILNVSSVTIVNATIEQGASFTLSGNDLTLTGTLSNQGTVFAQGTETVSITTPDTDSGLFEFTGNNASGSENFTIPNLDYFDVKINDTAAASDVFRTPGDLTISGSLTLTDGEFDISTNVDTVTVGGTLNLLGGLLSGASGGLDVNDGVFISTGTLTAPGTLDFTIAGDFVHSGGTFISSSGTVTLDGTLQTVSANDTDFASFVKETTTADTLTFDTSIVVGNAPTFSEHLTLTGTSGGVLSIDSTTATTEAYIGLLSGATQTLNFLEVRDSNADLSGTGILLVARNSSEPNGNNTNWDFDGAIITWTGTMSTDWNDPTNWDLGVVPSDEDTAIIPAVSTLPILNTTARVEVLTIQTGSTVTTNGNNLTVDGTLSNDGTVSVVGSETISIGVPDTDSGLFIYTGDLDGINDAFMISDIDFYDLVVNDVNATPDTFTVQGSLSVAGTVGVLGGTVDISTNAVTLTTAGTLTVNGGVLLATNGNIDVNSDVTIITGTLTAPTTGQSFTVARNWNLESAATFTHSSGAVTLDTTTNGTLTGETTFWDLTSSTIGKSIGFTSGSTQTVEDDFTITGTVSDHLDLRATVPGSPWGINFPNGAQVISAANLSDSNALTNIGTCFNCTNGGNNNANWVFSTLELNVPADNSVTDQTPTIIGRATENQVVNILDSSMTVVGTVTADSAGNWRYEIAQADALSVGANSLMARLGGFSTVATPITVQASPSASSQPTITSHSDGERVRGSTPTIAGQGLALTSFDILASDANGNLLLQTVVTGTTDAAGDYSATLTTPLPHGTNSISVTVNGVASDIVDLALVDPFGVVFDSVGNTPIKSAEVSIFKQSDNQLAIPGVDLASDDVNPVTTDESGFYSFLTVAGTYYITVDVAGFSYPSAETEFPAGRSIITGSKGEIFTVNGTILEMDHPMDATGELLRIEKDANKSEVKIGEVVTYRITIENLSVSNVNGILIEDLIPPGFKYLNERVTLDGVPIANPEGSRPLVFDIGSLTPTQIVELKYQLVVGSGVSVGKYTNTAVARRSNGKLLSNRATEEVEVVLDPLFDLGTVIGKVFFDKNENGIQDPPEYSHMDREVVEETPVPSVRIVMEDGTIITTDENGLFSLPALTPGRHLFRLDERTLPDNSYLTTDKVVIVDITPGLLVKVNFGVNLDDQRQLSDDEQFFVSNVKVTQLPDKSDPRLNIDLYKGEIVTYNDIVVDNAEFRMFTNYSPYIELWRFEIREKFTKKVIYSIEGDRLSFFDPIYWDGLNGIDHTHIPLDKEYEYLVYIEDKTGKFDQTKPKAISFRNLKTEEDYEKYLEEKKEIKPEEYIKWAEAQNKIDSLEIQTILVDGGTVVIDPLRGQLQSVRILKSGQLYAEMAFAKKQGLTARELLAGDKKPVDVDEKIEIILPKGDFEIVVQESEGVQKEVVTEKSRVVNGVVVGDVKEIVNAPARSYSTDVRVGEDYLFFVGLGDAQLGYNFNTANVETVAVDDRYQDGFWSEGKAAYYLQGKILGKYLITSSFDTERNQKELFKNLDPDEYYPIYGDESEVDYEATNTQGNLYVLIEWDKSSATWGNYSVNFGETEFARYSRTLYGGMLDYQSLSTTPQGDSRSKVILFNARAQQRSAHVEYLATGGSLYFLKHTNIIEGSDKVKIEVRDKITGLVISEREMVEGADYEMDYNSGRMVFWRAIPRIVVDYSIISSDLLDGNLIYVTADYEYELKDKFNERSLGGRVRQAIGDRVLVGGTYVKDTQERDDYELAATDVQIKLGEDASVTVEYAQTDAEGEGSFVSTDGGLSFNEITTGHEATGYAYGIKGDARLFNNLAVEAFYKWVDNNFSTSATTAQQGKESIGMRAELDLSEDTKITLRQDIQSLIDDGNLQTQLQVGSGRTSTTTAQITHNIRRLKLAGEYRRAEKEGDPDEELLALRADYGFESDKFDVFFAQQMGLLGDSGRQTRFGIVAKPSDKLKVSVTETIAEDGLATTFGLEAGLSERMKVKGDYTIGEVASIDSKFGVGGEYQLTEKVALTGDYSLQATQDSVDSQVSVGAITEVTEGVKLKTTVGVSGPEQTLKPQFSLEGEKDLELAKNTKVTVKSGVTGDDTGSNASSTVGIKSQLSEGTALDTQITREDGATTSTIGIESQLEDGTIFDSKVTLVEGAINQNSNISLGTTQQVDENTTVDSRMTVADSIADGRTTSFSFGSKQKINESLELASARTFGVSRGKETQGSTYSLVSEKDGRKLEGKLTRQYSQSATEVTQSNIFGLTGDIDDRWAFTSTFERGDVKNIDGTETDRSVFSAGLGYVNKDEETGQSLESSTKLEFRLDNGVDNKQQFLVYNSIEGKLNEELSLFTKLEYSRTLNSALDQVEAEHKEFIIGGAYRPLRFDQLNLIGRYTYLADDLPDSQEDFAEVEESRSHVIAVEGIYDFAASWQATQKFAYRIGEEKVAGFDFNKTHTWLLITRLNYKIDKDWAVGGEFRQLTVREAKDVKRGVLLELTRKMGEYAQMGVGYNFTNFDDNLTQLDYTQQGPFVRLTGKLYDQTPEEIERAKQRWIDEKVKIWAWQLVEDELSDIKSPVLVELNNYFVLAEQARENKKYEESQRIYKDILMATELMFVEASEHIRGQIDKEEELKKMNELADQYFKSGQYEKAKKILEKILEEAQGGMLE